jgi:hypothetical protein
MGPLEFFNGEYKALDSSNEHIQVMITPSDGNPEKNVELKELETDLNTPVGGSGCVWIEYDGDKKIMQIYHKNKSGPAKPETPALTITNFELEK